MSPTRRGVVLSLAALRAAFLAALLAALVVALVGAPAQAERDRQTDAAGDMVGLHPRGPAPAHRNLDLRRVVVLHTRHQVVIWAYMRALNVPRKSEAFGLGGTVKVNPMAQPQPSDNNVAWIWEVEFNARHRKHGTRLFILDAAYEEMYGCDGWDERTFTGRAYYKVDAVRVRIPRHCLAEATPWDLGVRPKWVRVSVSTATWDWDLEGGRRNYHDGLGSKPWAPFTTAHYTRRLYPGTPEEAVASAVTGQFSNQPSIAGAWAPVAGAWARLAPMISTRVPE